MAVPATTGAFRLTETGLSVIGTPTYDQCASTLEQARVWHCAVQWVIGGLVNYITQHFPDRADQLIDVTAMTGLELSTILAYAWVDAHVPPEIRRSDLPFHAHQLVAGLPVEAQKVWLERAAAGDDAGKWSTRRLQDELQQAAVKDGQALPCWVVVRCSSVEDAEKLVADLTRKGRVVKLHAGRAPKALPAAPEAAGDAP